LQIYGFLMSSGGVIVDIPQFTALKGYKGQGHLVAGVASIKMF
jgi:hypothetical protein